MAVLALLGVLLGSVAALVLPEREVARAEVVLEPLTGNPWDEERPDLVDLQTEALLARDDAVLQRVAQAHGEGASRAVERRLRVDVVDRSSVVSLELSGPPGEALPVLTTVVEGLLAERASRATSERSERAPALEASVAETRTALARLADSPRAGAVGPVLSRRFVALQAELAAVRSAAGSPGAVLSATARPDPLLQLRWLAPAAGALLGAAVGSAVVLRRRGERTAPP